MSKKYLGFLVVFFLFATVFSSQISAVYADTGITVQFNNGSMSTSSNSICANFKVINSTDSPLNLADLKLRYYYTADSDTTQSFFCDHSGMMNGNSYVNITEKVTGKLVKMDKTIDTADTYLEVGFLSDAVSIPSKGSIVIQTRITKSDWSNYVQSNDYSYKFSNTYTDWEQVTGFVKDALVSGKEAVTTTYVDPTISPKSLDYNKANPTSIMVKLKPEGNTLKEIRLNGSKSLTSGVDYSLSGDTVTLLPKFLATLYQGSNKIMFDFGVANNPILDISAYTSYGTLSVSVGTVTGHTGDIVTVPISLSNVAKAGGVGVCDLCIEYDPTLLEAVSVSPGAIVVDPANNFMSSTRNNKVEFLYLDSTEGSEIITNDGIFSYVTFKILGSAKTVPITFKDGTVFGNKYFEKITAIMLNKGQVIIEALPNAPTITPTAVVFNQNNPSNFTITINPERNTLINIIEFKSQTENVILRSGIDYSISDNKVTFLDSYLPTLAVGSNKIIFDFGLADNPTLNITVPEIFRPLTISIGTVIGNTGDTVTLPLSFSNVSITGGIATCQFHINYDPTLLEAISVSPGAIVLNPAVNFMYSINPGTINIFFLDDTIGSGLISKDGIFADITFKLLGINKTVPVTFKDGLLADKSISKISYANYTNGNVIIETIPKAPTINPKTVVFVRSNPSNITITLNPEGNILRDIMYRDSLYVSLRKGTDYLISGNTVTFLYSFLSTLNMSTNLITFDYGYGDMNPTLTITDPERTACYPIVSMGTVTGYTGDTVSVPLSLSSIYQTGGLLVCQFYLAYDPTLLEAISVSPGGIVLDPTNNFIYSIIKPGKIFIAYIDQTIGSELLTKSGVFANINFKILGSDGTAPITFTESTLADKNVSKLHNYYSGGKVIIESTPKTPTLNTQ